MLPNSESVSRNGSLDLQKPLDLMDRSTCQSKDSVPKGNYLNKTSKAVRETIEQKHLQDL